MRDDIHCGSISSPGANRVDTPTSAASPDDVVGAWTVLAHREAAMAEGAAVARVRAMVRARATWRIIFILCEGDR